MDVTAKRALAVIRDCVDTGRFLMLPHFRARMALRGLVWPDVLAVLDTPDTVRSGGTDRYDRPKWLVAGTAADSLPIEVVCVLDTDQRGDVTVFITLYER